MIRFLFFLFLVIPPSLNAQSSWETVTGDLPLPQRYLNADGSVRASRLFQFEDQVIVSTDPSLGKSVLISTSDGLNWKNFPEPLPANRFNVISRVQNRRIFTSLDPAANLRLMIPIGKASRLEVTYRNSEGTFLAKGYPGESFEFPSPEATKISDETSQELAVLSGEFINFPDLPDGQITNLARIGDTLIAQIGGSQRGQLYSWCPDCGTRELQGHWRNLSGQGAIDSKPQKMAGGSTNGFILQSLFVSSVTEVRKTTFGVRQSVGAAPDDTLHDIAWDSDTFIAVGADFDFWSNSSTGLILRKVGTQDWQTISVPEAGEFLGISRGSLGWLATSADGGIWSSPDGSEWQQAGESSFPIVALTENNNLWLASTEAGAVYSSTNLSSWNQQLGNFSGSRGITVAGSHFLTLGQSNLRRSPVAAEGAPDITGQPLSGSVIPNESVTLTVAATGQNLAYQWFTGESGDRSNPIAGATLPSFTTPALQADHLFWAEVSNDLDRDQSFTTEIVVQFQPTIERQPSPSSTTLDLSNFGGLSASISADGNGLNYQWYRGEPGDLTDPVEGETERSIYIRANTVGTDSYFVRVSNRIGFIDSDPISLTINPILPTITSQPEDDEVDAGSFVSLRVRASGPLLSYQWYQGEAGDTSNPVPNTDSSFFYPETDGAPETRYWVRVTNPAGHVDSSAVTVLLNYTPLEISFSSPEDLTLLAGLQGGVYFNVRPRAGVTLQWFEGVSGDTSTPITGATNQSFDLPDEGPGVFTYWARASNPVSTVDSPTKTVTRIAPDYEEWLNYYGVEADVMAPEASAAGDEFSNLFRYLAGLSPFAFAGDAFSQTHLHHDPESGDYFLAIDVRTRPLPEGASLLVEQSSSLNFDGTPAVEMGTPIPHSDQTITRTYHTSQPINSRQRQFLRVRVSFASE